MANSFPPPAGSTAATATAPAVTPPDQPASQDTQRTPNPPPPPPSAPPPSRQQLAAAPRIKWLGTAIVFALIAGAFAVLITDIAYNDPLGIKTLLAAASVRIGRIYLRGMMGGLGLLWSIATVCLAIAGAISAFLDSSAFEYRTKVYGLSGDRAMTVSRPLMLVLLALLSGVMAVICVWAAGHRR